MTGQPYINSLQETTKIKLKEESMNPKGARICKITEPGLQMIMRDHDTTPLKLQYTQGQ